MRTCDSCRRGTITIDQLREQVVRLDAENAVMRKLIAEAHGCVQFYKPMDYTGEGKWRKEWLDRVMELGI
jgi:hypothetical protein